mgnify:CR=1 FL=1
MLAVLTANYRKGNNMWRWVRNRYKDKLNTVSPSLCLAKWTQSNIYLGTHTTHSCHHCPTHTISLEDVKKNLSSLHNTKEKIEQRKLMLSGVRPDECNYCWQVEDSGTSISDRITKSFSTWSRKYFNKIIKAGANGINPTYIEISFDNRCNLRCSYCGPTFSSKWSEEIKRLGQWPKEIDCYAEVKNTSHKEHNPYTEAFWKWLPDIYQELHTLRVTGGEPLLSKNTFLLLDYVKENPNKNLTLGINSNLAVPDKNIDAFIEKAKQIKTKKLIIHASCDSYGSSAEYARHGLNYDKWLNNCQKILKELPNAQIDVMVTYNVFSVTKFLMFLQDIKRINSKKFFVFPRIKVSISYLRTPNHLVPWILPTEYESYIVDQIAFMKSNKFTSTEINQLERVLQLIISKRDEDKSHLRKCFNMFVTEHDRRRNTSFAESFPEMKEFLDLCK